jgi:sugar phosphate isomerase/epimerase
MTPIPDAAILSAVTISLVPEVKGGPFIFWDDLAAGCAQAAALGFDGVEIFPPSAAALDAPQLAQLLASHRLRLAAVGTGAGWALRRLSLTDPDAERRIEARRFVRDIIDVAASLGAPAIIGSMQGRASSAFGRREALAWLAEALEELGADAERAGAPLLIEPLNRYETNLLNRVDEALEVLRPLRTRNVKVLVDLFHANIEEREIAAALQSAGGSLGHVHFADSNRRPAGCGHTDFGAVAVALRAMGYAGFMSAEALPYPDPDGAARATIGMFRRLFGPACR